MKRLLAFLFSVLPAIAWGATPTFDSFRGTNSGFIVHQPYIYVANTNTGGTNVIINGDVIYTNTTISYFVTTNFYDQSTIIITNSTVTITNSTVTINGTNVATINPTVGRIPFKFSDFQFGDSALFYIDTNTVGTTELDTGALVLSFNQIPVTLVAGENDVDVTDHSYVALSSSDPSAQLRLNNGNGTVTMMLLNQTGTTPFTLFNGDTLWDDGTSHIYLPGGDWTPTHNGDGLLLFRVPVGWMEAARFFANTNVITQELWQSVAGVLQPVDLTLQPLVQNGWFVGTNSQAFWGGGLTNGESFVSLRNPANGEADYNELDVGVGDTNSPAHLTHFDVFGSSTSFNANLVKSFGALSDNRSIVERVSVGDTFLQIGNLSTNRSLLVAHIEAADGSAPHAFDTLGMVHTTGNLAEFANAGTNVVQVNYTGTTTFGRGSDTLQVGGSAGGIGFVTGASGLELFGGTAGILMDGSNKAIYPTSASSDQLTFGVGTNVFKAIILGKHPPANSTDTGTKGQIAWDSGFLYVCITNNVWVRTALSTF